MTGSVISLIVLVVAGGIAIGLRKHLQAETFTGVLIRAAALIGALAMTAFLLPLIKAGILKAMGHMGRDHAMAPVLFLSVAFGLALIAGVKEIEKWLGAYHAPEWLKRPLIAFIWMYVTVCLAGKSQNAFEIAFMSGLLFLLLGGAWRLYGKREKHWTAITMIVMIAVLVMIDRVIGLGFTNAVLESDHTFVPVVALTIMTVTGFLLDPNGKSFFSKMMNLGVAVSRGAIIMALLYVTISITLGRIGHYDFFMMSGKNLYSHRAVENKRLVGSTICEKIRQEIDDKQEEFDSLNVNKTTEAEDLATQIAKKTEEYSVCIKEKVGEEKTPDHYIPPVCKEDMRKFSEATKAITSFITAPFTTTAAQASAPRTPTIVFKKTYVGKGTTTNDQRIETFGPADVKEGDVVVITGPEFWVDTNRKWMKGSLRMEMRNIRWKTEKPQFIVAEEGVPFTVTIERSVATY